MDFAAGRLWVAAMVAIGVVAAAGPSYAQAPPDAGRILQETRPAERAPAPPSPPLHAPPSPSKKAPDTTGDARVSVSQFAFKGNAGLRTEVLQAVVARWSGRSLTFGELIEAVEAIEARYKEAGFFLAQAYLPPQQIRDGIVEISISEGRLGEARLEGSSRVSPDVLFRYLDRLPKDQPMQLAAVERQVLLINELAGGQTSLDLQAGEQPGTTDVVLAQKPEDSLSGRLDASNHGSPSTGDKRIGFALNANSPFNQGERISLNLLTTDTRGLASYNLRGDLPVGGDGWHLVATASRAEYSLGGAFADLKASGTADALRLGATYPLVRSRTRNLKLQIEGDHSKLKDKFETAGTQLDKKSRGLTVTLSADAQDEFMGGGSTRADLGLRGGRLQLGTEAAAQDAPPKGPGAAGSFQKASFTLQRQQTLTQALSLQLQLTTQAAGKNLDSSEKLSLGGPTSIPGYASGESSGDSGAHVKAGLRWQPVTDLAITLFADRADLTLTRNPVPGTAKNGKRLTDIGLGADWMIGKGVSANLLLAWAGREAPNPADNDKPRAWVSLAWAW